MKQMSRFCYVVAGFSITVSFYISQIGVQKDCVFKCLALLLSSFILVGSGGQEQGEDGEDSKDDDLSDADEDEDESDLDMAWKMLDIARAITDKQSTDTMEKVDILCTLAEISLERG